MESLVKHDAGAKRESRMTGGRGFGLEHVDLVLCVTLTGHHLPKRLGNL